MGEAKRRKEKDKYYGAVPQKGMGLVVSSPTIIMGDRVAVTANLDPQELRFNLLFWDRLVWPANNLIHIDGGADERFLDAAGILKRPKYSFQGSVSGSKAIVETQMRAFMDLSDREPGLWSMAEGERSFQNLNDVRPAVAGSMFHLHQAIPVPSENVPLSDILDFKNRRRDELLALRLELENFVQSLAKVGDQEGELRRAVTRIEMHCIDVIRVSSETKWPLRLTDAKTFFSVDFAKLAGPALIALAANGFGLPTLTSMLGGLGLALNNGFLAVRSEGNLTLKENRLRNHPYRYVASFNKELFNG